MAASEMSLAAQLILAQMRDQRANPQGSGLLGSRSLAEIVGEDASVARSAIQELVDLGILVKSSNSHFESGDLDRISLNGRTSSELVSVSVDPADEKEREWWNLADGANVICRMSILRAIGEGAEIIFVRAPQDRVGPRFAMKEVLIPPGAVEYIEESTGQQRTRRVDSITVHMCDSWAEALGGSPADLLFDQEQHLYADGDALLAVLNRVTRVVDAPLVYEVRSRKRPAKRAKKVAEPTVGPQNN